VIQLADANYNENVRIDPRQCETRITIKAAPDVQVVWAGDPNDPILRLSNARDFHLDGKGITFDGEKNNKRLIVLSGKSDGLLIEGATFKGYTKTGIEVMNCIGLPSRPARLKGLTFPAPPGVDATAIFFAEGSLQPPHSDHVEVSNCDFTGFARRPVQSESPEVVKNVTFPPMVPGQNK